jgi:hypothetical protein
MAARRAVAERGPVTDRALMPALAETRLGDTRDGELEFLRSAGAPARVHQRRLRALAHDHAVMEVLTPAAQVDRAAVTLRFL